MNFLQTLRHRLFGGAKNLPQEQNPWEKVAPSVSGQLSPDAMRETYADFFLYAMYEKLDLPSAHVNFSDTIMTGISIEFEAPWHAPLDTIIYKQGTIHVQCLLVDVCIATLPLEQDRLVRKAIAHFIHRCKSYDLHEPHIGWLYHRPFNIKDELPIAQQKLITRFTEYVNDWHKHTPLSTPVLCDGCPRRCQLGQNQYTQTIVFEDFCRRDRKTIPTINYCLADKFYDKSGNLVSADKGVWPTQYVTAREIAKRCPSWGTQKQR